MSIQSIVIPLTQTRPSPKPHTVYQIKVSTGVRSWDTWRRYSDFESLVQELKSETGKDVEGESIPPKSIWSFRKSVGNQKVRGQSPPPLWGVVKEDVDRFGGFGSTAD